MSPSRERALTQCSLCGRSNRETGPQVEGPGEFYLCGDCTVQAYELVQKHRKSVPIVDAREPD